MNRRFSIASFTTFAVGLLGAVVLSASWLPAQQAAPADLLLHNGKILTVDLNFSVAQAVAIRGNQISAVGSNADLLKLAGPQTTVIDLKGRTVVPGLIDTHLHIHNIMESAYESQVPPDKLNRLPIDWRGVRSKDDVLAQIKSTMDKYRFEPGKWVYFQNLHLDAGGSLDQAIVLRKILYEGMNRYDLDKAAPNNPIMLDMGVPDTSGFFVNSKAIDILWGEAGNFLKKYGRYWIDSSGRPDGHLEPPGNRILFPYMNSRSPDVLAPLYKYGLEELAAMGTTTVSSRFPEDTVAAYRLLESQGELTARFAYGLEETFGHITDPQKDMKAWASKMGAGSDKIWINSMGLLAADGHTARACMSIPRTARYEVVDDWWPMGMCHMDNEFRGAAGKAERTSGNYFRDWMTASGLNGVRFANTHVAGERTVHLILGMAEQAAQQAGPNAVRGWAMDHCTFVNPADLKQAARLGIMFSCAPKYAIANTTAISKAYDEKVANTWVVPVKSMLDAGVKVAFETDRDIYVWEDIQNLITRKDKNGKVWGPQERIDRTAALKMATRWSAEYVLKGDKLGTLEPGKLADLLVLDRDYLTIPEEQIREIQPQVTVFDGKITFVHSQFAQEYNLRPAGAVVATYPELLARRPRSAGGGD